MAQKSISKHTIQNNSNHSANKIIAIGVIILVIFIYIFSNKENKMLTDVDTVCITKSGYKASYNKQSMQRLVECSVHRDYECIDKLLYSGEIFELPSGQEAHVVKSEYPGKVRIRLKGETQDIWTFIEAIQSK
ncbi:hypothetical protein [Chryseobacterium sp. EO14]|uniref:hypothetical protein n=1 Tax=Chryseobacterium sp. EO14 TaxID=2950551 RepID=UPI00210CDF69|nr:hypothetical protein [Chryseobacterium sp. EO14]MCQ4139854.1 hypothetical protein [Chryseobacterium sp. EO14]